MIGPTRKKDDTTDNSDRNIALWPIAGATAKWTESKNFGVSRERFYICWFEKHNHTNIRLQMYKNEYNIDFL